MNRRRDIDDLDETLFTAGEAERRRLERADTIERGKQADEALAAFEKAAKARIRTDILAANDEFIAREYALAGVTPPETAGGKPTVSLSMLLRLGWQIEESPRGGKVLVAAPTPEKYVARGENG